MWPSVLTPADRWLCGPLASSAMHSPSPERNAQCPATIGVFKAEIISEFTTLKTQGLPVLVPPFSLVFKTQRLWDP